MYAFAVSKHQGLLQGVVRFDLTSSAAEIGRLMLLLSLSNSYGILELLEATEKLQVEDLNN